MSKLLLSFLGAGNYQKCVYFYKEKKFESEYIQTALADIVCSDWSEGDEIKVIMTPTAKKRHYENLKNSLESLNLKCQLSFIELQKDVLNSEKEMWEMFRKLLDELSERQEIYLDITHSFRFYPVLLLSLITFAEVIKNCELKEIFYGNFEARNQNNEAPILSLKNFSRLINLAMATRDFVDYGIAENLTNLLKKEVSERKAIKRQEDEITLTLKKLYSNINNFSKSLYTCRGKEVIAENLNKKKLEELAEKYAEFYEKQPNIPKLKAKIHYNEILKFSQTLIDLEKGTYSSLLSSLFGKIEKEFKNFEEGNIDNLLEAAKWCCKHNMIQQGYTFLVEWFISKITEKIYGKDYIYCVKVREKAVNYIKENSKLNDFYKNISKLRNDINHCGMREDSIPPNSLKENLEEKIKEAEEFIKVLKNF